MVWLQYFKQVRDLSLFRLANALELGDVEENVCMMHLPSKVKFAMQMFKTSRCEANANVWKGDKQRINGLPVAMAMSPPMY